MVVIARWESIGGMYWIEVYLGPGQTRRLDSVNYRHRKGGGCLGSIGPDMTEEQAVGIMQSRITYGGFVPDSATNPMRRVA